MRNTLLSRPQLPSRARSPSPEPTSTPTQAGQVPTIRLIAATPSAAGSSQPNTSPTFANTSLNSIANSSWASVPSNPSPLAPKPAADSSRKRLVPKKSKLSLLGGGKEKGKDLSDVVRRLGGTESTGRGGFEIYVDTTQDPDLGEIVVVKKKKSRAGLDGLRWGALGEVTNVPSNGKKDITKENLLKVKGDEKEKWWSIGRGRKDSKEKEKEKAKEKEKQTEQEQQSKIHSKSPDPTKAAQPAADQRARFNSLDSGTILGSQPARPWTQRSVSSSQLLNVPQAVPEVGIAPLATVPRAEATTVGGLLAPPGAAPAPGANSIAIRAMRSVRSLARIGSWAQLKGASDENGNVQPKSRAKESDREKDKDKEGDDAHKKKKKKKRDVKVKEKEGRAQGTVRSSTSSFEAGALSASPLPAVKSLGKKKQSILGLGLPSTMRLPTVRGGSTASSACPPVSGNRLSIESALNLNTIMRGRAGSTVSTASSLRPMSTSSGVSSGSSGASVRWDEECLQTVKERRLKERRESAESAVSKDKSGRESRRSSGEGRRRTSLAAVFPETRATSVYPIVTVEEATADGHEAADNEELLPMGLETPVRKARPRPVSEQLLGRSRPVGICDEGDGAISILSAATNDLAQLINRLDLEATPGTPDMTPLKATPSRNTQEAESPIKKNSRMEASSITSLRPYAQSRSKPAPMPSVTPDLLGQQIAPWPTSPDKLPVLKSVADPKPAPSTFRLTHKRTLSPAPAAEPLPVFQPLRPSKARQLAVTSIIGPSASPFLDAPAEGKKGSPSSQTFGSRSSSTSLASTHSPVFKKTSGHSRKRSSLAPADNQAAKKDARTSMPIPPEAKRVLGLAGTMGGSEASGLIPADLDVSDPDSDIPDELQVILSGQSDKDSIRSVDDTLSYRRVSCEDAFGPPSPGCPPEVPLPRPVSPEALALPEQPVFRAELIDDEDNHADIDEAGNSSSDEDTKKSFDFTGELKKLNESGASDRRSFVEQLENAFRTPARVDLRYDFGGPFQDGYLGVDVPPVPKLPTSYAEVSAYEERRSSNNLKTDEYSGSQLVDISVPSMMLVSGSESDIKGFPVDLSESDDHHELKKTTSMRSRPSDGQLNTGFKFGCRPPAPPCIEEEKPLTLSDIIPPPSHKHSRSMSFVEEDSSVLKSIYAKASEIPPSVAVPRPRLNSDSSSKRRFRDDSRLSYATSHRRHSSEMSFVGFESFAEVRRGFEFSVNRPAFYPPPAANTSRGRHVKQDSVFSIASVSSYGMLINPGSTDPFDFANSRLPERRFSDDMSVSMSMSMSVDDTFSFIHRQPRRRRVESDASSFYFDAPARGHRRHESAMSTTSMAGPPVSLYNRSFGGHRRSDSNTSGSSVAHTYAMYGANGGRAAWARHRTDMSIDSVQSDFSAMHLGRPGLGDKMLESGLEHGAPLTSISASPPESMEDMRVAATNRFSYDSIMDDDQRFTTEDSIFEKTGNRTSVSSESVFGEHDMEPANGALLPMNHFRPLSVLSGASIHSANKDDDTMITMFDGDHVRRRSVGSVYEGSPCVRAEKRKQSTFRGMLTGKRLEFETIDDVESPNKARIIEKPSIASTTSYKFGGERMIRAKRGLLERQSLEDSCLSADGEDFTTSLQPQPVFSRPGPASRSRSSTCTSGSGADTPPLSLSDGSSSGSQSSIDISRLNLMLSNVTHPMTGSRARSRARARGQGHRRRISQARMSRASVYETIEEEMSSYSSTPSPVSVKQSGSVSPVSVIATGPEHAVYVVNPSISSIESVWDDDRGLVALRKYYALRDEAHETVTESKLIWPDTQFSVFATQAFDPPKHPAGMQALLAHSLQNYGPLPSELRPRRIRSRTHSRASPYPQPYPTSQPRAIKTSFSNSPELSPEITRSARKAPLQQVSINPNISASRSPVPPGSVLDALKPMSPFSMEILNEYSAKNPFGLNMELGNAPPVRPRVPSSTRRTALGWTKRSTGAGSKGSTGAKMSTGAKTTTTPPATATVVGKENTSVGMTMTPGESLRINRPRPRGRPTPAAAKRAIRV